MKRIISVFVLLAVVYGKSGPGKILGGRPVDITEAPYTVSIHYYNMQLCGGVLLTLRVVLSAAHCVRDRIYSHFSVRAGTSQRYGTGYKVNVKNVYVHDQYDFRTRTYDAVILTLFQPLPRSDKINSILVSNHHVEQNQTIYIYGWGSTSEGGSKSEDLLGTEVYYIDRDYCQTKYKLPLTVSMFCGGVMKGGKDSCQGDSGGPAVMKHGDIPYLVGITSWGTGCGRPGVPGIYTDVSVITGWIATVVTY